LQASDGNGKSVEAAIHVDIDPNRRLQMAEKPPSTLLQPSALFFGEVPLGTTSPPQTLTLTNLGSAPFSFTTESLLNFAQSNDCSGSVAPGASCAFQVTFTPPGGGQSEAVLEAFGTSGSKVAVDLVGFGTPELRVVPCCVSFFEQPGEKSAPQTVVVTNTGNASIQFNTPNNSDGTFSEKNNCTTLAPNQSCQVTVTFLPSGPGGYSGGVGLVDNAPPSNDNVIQLAGTLTDFSFGTPMPATVKAGQTANYNLEVMSDYGFFGTVNLACSGAPARATCNVSPSTVPVEAFQSTSFTVIVRTTGPSNAGTDTGMKTRTHLLAVFASFSLTFLVITTCRYRKWNGTRILLLLSFLLMTISCGGGSGTSASNGGGGGGGSSGTAAGNYSLTLSGTVGGTTHNATLALTVQ
jgi:hypothetical protein